MIRAIISLFALTLFGCSQPPNAAICQKLPSADEVEKISSKIKTLKDSSNPKDISIYQETTRWLASTCVRKTAYKFAMDKANNQGIADAVLAGCQFQASEYASSDAAQRATMIESDRVSTSWFDEFERFKAQNMDALSKLALASVVEARAGHCEPVA